MGQKREFCSRILRIDFFIQVTLRLKRICLLN